MAPGKNICWFAFCLAASVLPCFAQAPIGTKDGVFWEVRQRQQAGAAAQMVLARDPLTIVVLREEGFRWKVWREPEFLSDTAPLLSSEWLDKVRDGTPMPDFRGKAEDEKRPDQIAIYKIWMQAIVHANNAPLDAFAKSAEENSHVTFAHLYNNPEEYRGKVIPIKGRLVRLRKYEATWANKEGVPFVYEGWIFGPTPGSNPFNVVFPILPDGLKEAEKMDREVSFNGYFIKKLQYPAADRSKYLETPVLIGPTVTLVQKSEPPAVSTSLPMTVIVWLVALIVAVAIGLVFISWYFHRGDKALQQRLARMQTASEEFPLPDEISDKENGI